MKTQKIRQVLYIAIVTCIFTICFTIVSYAAPSTGTMAAPESISWDAQRFNRVNFTHVDNAYGYEIEVYRGSSLIYNIADVQSNNSYYDVPMYYFIEDGDYKVAVAALASEDELEAFWNGEVLLNYAESPVKSYYPEDRMPMVTGVTWTNDKYVTWDAVDGVDDYAVVVYSYVKQNGVYFWYRFDEVTGTRQDNYLDFSKWKGYDHIAVQVFAISSDINTIGPGPLQSTAYPNDNSIPFVDCTYASGGCGENSTFIYANGNLYINGSGPIYDYLDGETPWNRFSSRIVNLTVAEGISELYGSSFSNLSNLGAIEYCGSKESWVNIKKTDFENDNCQHMLTLNVKCADGTYIPLAGPQNLVLSQDSATGYLQYSFDPVEGAGGYYVTVTYSVSGSAISTVMNQFIGASYASDQSYNLYISSGMQEIYVTDCSVYVDVCTYQPDDCIAVLNGTHKLCTKRSNTFEYRKANTSVESVQNISWNSTSPIVSWDKVYDCDGYEITIYKLIKDDDKYEWINRCSTNLKPSDTSFDISKFLYFDDFDSDARDIAVEIRTLSGNLNNKAHSELSNRIAWKWNYSNLNPGDCYFYLATYSKQGQMLSCEKIEYSAFTEFSDNQKFFVLKENSFVPQ